MRRALDESTSAKGRSFSVRTQRANSGVLLGAAEGAMILRLVAALLMRCCAVVPLLVALSSTTAAQSAGLRSADPRPTSSKTADREPLSLFPLRTLWTLALNSHLTVPPVYDATSGYFAIEGERLVAYDLTAGSRRWLVPANPQLALAVGEGLLFLVEPTTLTALHADDGSAAWRLPLAEKLTVPPV